MMTGLVGPSLLVSIAKSRLSHQYRDMPEPLTIREFETSTIITEVVLYSREYIATLTFSSKVQFAINRRSRS